MILRQVVTLVRFVLSRQSLQRSLQLIALIRHNTPVLSVLPIQRRRRDAIQQPRSTTIIQKQLGTVGGIKNIFYYFLLYPLIIIVIT